MDREIMQSFMTEVMGFTELHSETVLDRQWTLVEFEIAPTLSYRLFEFKYRVKELGALLLSKFRA